MKIFLRKSSRCYIHTRTFSAKFSLIELNFEDHSTSYSIKYFFKFKFLHSPFPGLEVVVEVEWWNVLHVADLFVIYVMQVKPEIVSWSPRIIVFHNFLSMEVWKELLSFFNCWFFNSISKLNNVYKNLLYCVRGLIILYIWVYI